MNKVLKIIACGCLAALPGVSFALGLGEIDVQSKLNQNLRAEIRLLYTDVSEPQSTEVSLASAEDFERVGLDRSIVPAALDFSVVQNDSGDYVILVTSDFPVDEPFLDFLIEVNWANGRLLREYVVLLDPPVVAPSAGAAEVTPLEEEPQLVAPRPDLIEPQQPVSEPAIEPIQVDEPFVSSTPSPISSGAAGDYGPTVAGDTLWEIARDWRPSEEVSINQMMLLMFQMNPDAFYQDNINALKQGAILRLPDSGDIAAMSAEEALAVVRLQNELWESYRQTAAARPPTVSDAGSSAEYTDPQDAASERDRQARLELVPAASDSSSEVDRPGSSVAALQSEVTDLRADIARSREELISTDQENAELRSRLTELEDLVENYERAISLKDADLADLQRQLEAARQASGELAADVASQDDTLSPQDDAELDALLDALNAMQPEDGQADTDSPTTGGLDTPQIGDDQVAMLDQAPDSLSSAGDLGGGDDAAVEPQASVSVPSVTTQPRPPRPSLMDQAMDYATNPYVLGGVGGLLVLIVAGVVLSRRRGAGSAAGGGSMVDEFLGQDSGGGDILEEDEFDLVPSEQGEDDLVAAVQASPTDPQAHLALLRSYYAQGQRDEFVDAAAYMLENIGGDTHPAWMEVRAMGANLAPDHDLFASSSEPGSEADALLDLDGGLGEDSQAISADDELDLSLDLDEIPADGDDDLSLDFDSSDSAPAASPDSADDADLSLDFDLGEDGQTPAAEVAGQDTDDLSLDFDLDDSAVETAAPASEDSDLSLDLDLDGGSSGDELSLDLGGDSPPSDEADGLDFDLDGLDLTLDEGETASPAADESTEFELEAVADDAPVASDEKAGSSTLAELESADDDLGDLGLDDLDLGDTNLLGEEDSIDTKLDLAKAYIDMGDPEGARGMLEEVMSEGNPAQKEEAEKLIDGIGS